MMPAAPAEDHVRVHRLLEDCFQRLCSASAHASERTGVVAQSYTLAGHHVRLSIAGKQLASALAPAWAHMISGENDDAAPALEILAWDETESGVSAPELPWAWSELSGTVRLVLPPGGEAFRVHAYEEGVMFFMYSVAERKAVFWTKDARQLPTFFRAAPFLTLMHWWSKAQGLRLVHAGAVGTDAGAALIAGKGGSGKSTTSLLCVLAGMHFLSDDFCLVQAGEEPQVHCLNSSGKLHRDHFLRFPELAARSVDPVPDAFDKPLIFMHEHFPSQVKPSLPLRAVIVPQVTGTEHTTFEPLPPAMALRALTSSTMFQFSPDDGSAFRDMAAVLRGLPCFRLLLGTRTEEIAPAVRNILNRANEV
ncbi:hypothetical protein [Roseimicrobium sp. ORNL1]|uniref:hypothetical protein n=1 Tax=Roseimicrobium sp. ORNL1 TaxID=2711231 RepID=UPI0013E0FF03|nr:hypothetical protein [Roseimicrobium sp. ORNL1]QIF05777.1 hypothetical protein G5S37_31200 [Roseimicrobium sp. ORNL1]